MHFFFNSWRTKTVVEQTLTALFVLFVATKAEEEKAVFGLQLEVFIAFVLQVYLYAFIKFTTTAFIYTITHYLKITKNVSFHFSSQNSQSCLVFLQKFKYL